MDSKAIRRANLLRLLEQHGTLVALANATKTVPGHLSQVKNGTHPMGDKVARRIEEELGKERGWMDMLHDAPAELPEDERQLLDAYRRAPADWRAWLRRAAALPREEQAAYLRITGGRWSVHEALPPRYGEALSSPQKKRRAE